jgi:hypothetical protein
MGAHCERCDKRVDPVYRQPRLRKIARGYLLLPAPFILVIPIMASDYVFSLPLFMIWMLGLGSVFRIILDPAVCPTCGAFVEPPTDPNVARWRVVQQAGRAGRAR